MPECLGSKLEGPTDTHTEYMYILSQGYNTSLFYLDNIFVRSHVIYQLVRLNKGSCS